MSPYYIQESVYIPSQQQRPEDLLTMQGINSLLVTLSLQRERLLLCWAAHSAWHVRGVL